VHIKRHLLLLTTACLLTLAACGGDSAAPSPVSTAPPTSPPPPPPPPPPAGKFFTELETETEAARFIIQAGLGANPQEISSLMERDAADWLQTEFQKPRTNLMAPIANTFNATGDVRFNMAGEVFWDALFAGDDALRLRMTYALSQIFVISDVQVNDTPLATGYYMDLLSQNAFGNFRDLLTDVTYAPAMGDFLTFARNRKGDEHTGRVPDENYAREILQLFTIGLVDLNMDGTPKLSGGEPIESYDNDDIRGLARVFTGLSYKGSTFWNRDEDSMMFPLVMHDDFHSELEKNFLGATIGAGTGGTQSIDQALDAIFEHPNVPPFIARQLIQRFTASDPDPAYVRRVAESFAGGTFQAPDGTVFGTGQRGDFQATLAAILLDESIHAEPGQAQSGKVREPVLKLVQWGRAFDVRDPLSVEEWRLNDTSSPADRLGQQPFRANSVFNFYRPGFIAPGTQAGEAGLTTPEFQIVNEGAALGYINFMTDFIYDRTGNEEETARFTPDYSDEINLADDPAALIDHLDLVMTGSRMSDQEKSAVIRVVETLTLEDLEEDPRQRVNIAVLLVASLPSYAIID